MYSDKLLEFQIAERDTPAVTTRKLPMGQSDLSGDTTGMGPNFGLWLYADAGEDLSPGFTLTLQHADTEAGPFEDLIAFPALTVPAPAGKVLVKMAVPREIKNWVQFALSDAVKLNIIFTVAVDKWVNGLVK
jgi:hypothetical protein